MKIALSTPNYWPYIRRGTARYVSLLAGFLSSRGHRVTILASKPGKAKQVSKDGIRVKFFSYREHPLFMKHIDRMKTFGFAVFIDMLKENYDIVYCMHHPDGFAASLAKKIKKTKYLFNITGVPFSKYWGDSRAERFLFEQSIHHADGLLLPSEFSGRCMREEYDLTGNVVSMPVEMTAFAGRFEKDPEKPVILFVSDLADRRKGLHILLPAFYRLKQSLPGAVLLLAGQVAPYTSKCLEDEIPTDMKSSIFIHGQGRLEELPAIYGRATLMVLPSLDEVFGMVLVESLAAGTPVVGSASGAIPEIITNDTIGRLFDPQIENGEVTNIEGLCQAMLDVYELSLIPGNGDQCRQHASNYDIDIIGAKIEKYLLSIVRS